MNSKAERDGLPRVKDLRGALREWTSAYAPSLVVTAAFLLFAAQMFQLISNYAVNIFFSDQWEFNDATLFQKHSLWQMFSWQHGPHRQGLGALFAELVDPPFHWNSRIESFIVGGVVAGAAICGLWLKKRLYGRLSVFDVAIPAIFFTPGQWETLVLTPNFAHGSFPLLLLVLYCLAWTVETQVVRYALILLINFVAIYTGFGLLLGILTPFLLVLDHWTRQTEVRLPTAYLVGAVLVSLASLGSFFLGYKFKPYMECFSFQPQSPQSYLAYVAVMCSNFFTVKGGRATAQNAGFIILIALLASVVIAARLLLRRDGLELQAAHRAKSLVPLILISYTLLFCVATAYGRVCGGLWSAQSSRYVIYLELAMFGFYLQLLNSRQTPRQRLLLIGFVASVITASTFVDRSVLTYFRYVKQEWKTCYMRTEDIIGCNRFVGVAIVLPAPEKIHLQEKLQFLKATGQNLYLDSR